MTDRKAYQKEWARRNRQKKAVDTSTQHVDKPSKVSTQSVDSVSTIKYQDKVDRSIFDGIGRGVPVNGYVMISRGLHIKEDEERDRIVTEEVWRARLDQTCEHGFEGWTCKRCLP